MVQDQDRQEVFIEKKCEANEEWRICSDSKVDHDEISAPTAESRDMQVVRRA
jgi:hypothetical protein